MGHRAKPATKKNRYIWMRCAGCNHWTRTGNICRGCWKILNRMNKRTDV